MAAHREIQAGGGPDDQETWPSRELIDSFLGGSWDFELRPGETMPIGSRAAAGRARHFRDVLSRFASGVAVVTAIDAGEPVGMTCQSFSSVSLDPQLVLFCPAKTSRAWPRIRSTGHFCVNVLAESQHELSDQFAQRGTEKYAGVSWAPGPGTGSPLIEGVLAWVDCRLHAVHEAGDHWVVIGEVVALGHAEEDGPEHGLIFYRGRYGTTAG